jgi:hypothetical protein
MATLEREKSRVNPFLREPDPVHAPIAALERRHSSGDDSHAPAKELAKSTKSGLSEDGTRKLFALYADRQQGLKRALGPQGTQLRRPAPSWTARRHWTAKCRRTVAARSIPSPAV